MVNKYAVRNQIESYVDSDKMKGGTLLYVQEQGQCGNSGCRSREKGVKNT